jgi:uncharacterized iron-regulated protein
MTTRLSSPVALLFSLAFAFEAHAHTVITRVTDGREVSISELAAVAVKSDVTLVGESHDNKDHHDLQLDLIRSMHGSKAQLAIGLEMMQADSQRHLDDWVEGKVSEATFEQIFAKNWSEDWPIYRQIFLFARDNHIPMVALNVPIDIVKKVSHEGFASLSPEERKGLPEGTSCDLKNPQIALLRRSFKAVGRHGENGKVFTYFCEAQTVRNSGMAIAIKRYLQKNPQRKMVVITGIWHAVKYAIPTHLESLAGDLSYTVIIPETAEMNRGNTSAVEADYLIDL